MYIKKKNINSSLFVWNLSTKSDQQNIPIRIPGYVNIIKLPILAILLC